MGRFIHVEHFLSEIEDFYIGAFEDDGFVEFVC